MKHAISALLLAFSATPVLADEVWTTKAGEIVYESTLAEGTAVFVAPAILFNPSATKGAVVRIYIPYLDAAPDSRYRHEGYWLMEGSTYCLVSLTGPDGITSSDWGLVDIFFDEAGFPSGFTMTWGICEYEKFEFVRAEPVVGE